MAVEVDSSSISEKREECGVVGIYSKRGADVAPLLYRALFALQHRGQDAAGFAVYNGKEIDARKGIGLVEQVFTPGDLETKGAVGIGHTRYPTIGECKKCDVQPSIYKNVAVVHNGHIANYDVLKKELEGQGYRLSSTVDSEPIAFFVQGNEIEAAVKEIMEKFEGSFSDVALVDDKLVAFRDRHAIRPLVWGENGDFVSVASETVALDVNGIPYRGDIRGGECFLVGGNKEIVKKQLVEEKIRHCMFEYVYFSRPDSLINNKSVYGVREKLGGVLAAESPVKADVVVPVPDTSRTAASSFAKALGLEYAEGLIKNRYIGRTFIMPSQEKRVNAVKLKLNPLGVVVEGKSVVLVDDSIVRGTTLREIVRMVKNAGAAEIHLRITCPPIKAPCFYGVDIPTYNELIANNKTEEEIRDYLGADSLHYLSLDGLKKSIGLQLCTGCLTGEYHTNFVRGLAQKNKEK